MPGVYTLKNFVVYDQCENFKQYGGANAAFPGPTSFLIVNGTLSTGSLEVYIGPQAAEYAGTWNVDGGNTEYSGFPVTGLAPGPHVVNFLDAFGYTTPAPQNVTIVANQTTYTTGTYIAQTPTDSVQVSLVPAVTGSDGGLWTLDDGPLQSSGATVSGLYDGAHTIQFTDVSGYTTPASQAVTTAGGQTTVTSGTYTPITQTGSLTVTIDPAGARSNGAKWNVDGGAPQSSGNTLNGIAVGNHFVNFTAATSYTAPLSDAVVIGASALTSTNGTYTVLASSTGALTVNITPSGAVKAGAEWNLDGGPSHASGATLTGLSGAGHVVNFTMVNGYITPVSQPVDLVPNATVVLTDAYTVAPGFTGAAESFVGISQSGYALLTLALEATGKFTGKLLVEDPSTYSLSGSFNSTGYFAGQTGKPPIPYILQVTGSTPGTYLLTGSAQGHQITAYPAAYAKGQTVAEIGTYTALFTGTDPSAAIPQGTGYGTLTVSKTGAGSINGKLADGTSYTASSILVAGTGGRELIIFDPNIYSKKGLLSGVFNFGIPVAGQLDGTLLWDKPDLNKGSYYPAGFVTALGAIGALYSKAIPLPFTSGTLTLTGGGLATTGTAPFTLTAKGAGTIAKPDKLSIKTATGAVSGAFKAAGAAKAVSFSGLLLQDGANSRAAGYFLGPVVSGSGTSGSVTLP